VIEFRRVHNQIQMLARNTEFVAAAGTPTGRSVAVAFSPSLLASTAVASQPHPERKSVLVEANALFINDMTGVAAHLQRHYRQGYALDARNSAITEVRGNPDLLVLEVLSHYATASIAMPAPGAPAGTPQPTAPRLVPDPRSLFMTLHYSLAKLPEQPMAPRKADGRVGYFTSNLSDYTDDLTRTPRQRYVNRWRLEKKDPTAAVSEPKEPIRVVMDRNIPEKWRPAVKAGILEWNKAFEKAGFRNAIAVEQQAADADWSSLIFQFTRGVALKPWPQLSVRPFCTARDGRPSTPAVWRSMLRARGSAKRSFPRSSQTARRRWKTRADIGWWRPCRSGDRRKSGLSSRP
jgi:hypothetical protein